MILCPIMPEKHSVANFRRFSDAISDPLIKAYQAGEFGLALLTLGAILMLVAFFWDQNGPVRYVVLTVGAVLIFFVVAYVYFKQFPKLKSARSKVVASKEMIDAIQQSAIELTEIASDLQALAFKNATQISDVLSTARPLIRKLPIIGKVADSEAMIKVDGLSKMIVTTTENTRKIIAELQASLIEADPKCLQLHLNDLRRYKSDVKRMLSGQM